MEKTHGRVNISRNGERLHTEALYSNYGPECLVHQEAASVYRFFADDLDNVTGTCYVYSGDLVQVWTRKCNDHTFKLTSSFDKSR